MGTPSNKWALAALMAAFFAVTGTASAVEMAIIDKRIEVMKNVVLKNLKVVKGYLSKGQGTASDVARAADALAAVAPKIPALFPQGTGRPTVDAKKTRAKADIWQDWKKFVAASKVLETEAAKLAKVAAGGDKDAINAQFGVMGKKGCGGCHKPFRGPKVK